jgi:Na+-driven multidrug efflux pump
LLLDSTDRALFRRIWSLTWPMVLSNGLEMTVGLIDLLLVRPFGPSATAAIGVSRQVTFVVEAAAGAIATGVLTLVSQRIGARSSGQVQAVVRQSVRLVLLIGLPVALAGYLFSGYLLAGLQVSAETLAWGEPYLRVYFVGLVFSWGNLVGTATFRGAGDVWTPLKLYLAVSLLNVALNYLFIYGAGPVPAFEVMGAALGTVVARACGTVAFLALLWRGTAVVDKVTRWQGDQVIGEVPATASPCHPVTLSPCQSPRASVVKKMCQAARESFARPTSSSMVVSRSSSPSFVMPRLTA